MTGPKTDPRPGDTARHAFADLRVLARRGDVVDLEVRGTPTEGWCFVDTDVPVAYWSTCQGHARRDPLADPQPGDVLVRPTHGGYVVKVVVEGVDTAAVWVRNHDNGSLGQTRVRREDWDVWVADNGLYGVTD